MNDRTLLVISPPPTPNGPLHLGHLSGPYVAADIAARAARARGQRVTTMCGLDSHQNYVLARAEQLGEPVEQTLGRYSGLVREGLAAARIDHDIFVQPTVDAGYRSAVAELLTALVDTKAAVVADTWLASCGGCGRVLHHARVSGACATCGEGSGGGTCEGCGSFTTGLDLVGAVSSCCAAAPKRVAARVPVLRLEDYRERLLEMWAGMAMPGPVRRLVNRYLRAGLPEVPLAYSTDWGVRWDNAGTETRVDVWAEMGLGYLYAVARHLDPAARTMPECAHAWEGVSQTWIFLGIDNAFYYAILVPAMLIAAGVPASVLTGLVVNEFYRLDGHKFSTSRDHAIWAHEILATEDPGAVRAYLTWDRPDSYAGDFTLDAYRAFLDRYRELFAGPASPTAGPASPTAGPASPTASPAGPTIDGRLAGPNLERAARALELDTFDPSLAMRCLLATLPAPAAREMLALVTGDERR